MENKKKEANKTFKQKLLTARLKINNPKRGGIDNYKKRKYVTLQDLYDEALPVLLEEGLLLINYKAFLEDKLVLITKIEDSESEEFIDTFAVLNESLKIQEQGAELTYNQRYNLGCLLSIRTDYDDDAESIKNAPVQKPKLITAEQVQEISKKLSELKNGERVSIIKAIGTGNLNEIKADRYESVCKLINNTIKRKGENNDN